jgi:syntaxin-binding protein 5
VNLQVLYKLKTAKLFEKPKLNNKTSGESSQQQESVGLQENDDPFAIEQLAFCSDSRYLCVAGASSQVIVFRFSKHEAHTEVPVSYLIANKFLFFTFYSLDFFSLSNILSLLSLSLSL